MKKVVGLTLMAAFFALTSVFSGSQAQAAWCGAASYRWCRPTACDFTQQCSTVMKTCRKVVYEQEQVTCYRTVLEKVAVPQRILCTRYVP